MIVAENNEHFEFLIALKETFLHFDYGRPRFSAISDDQRP